MYGPRLGQTSEAWRGDASDFTPLLNEQLDALGIDLVAVVMAALHTAGGRRIVAEHAEASEPSRR